MYLKNLQGKLVLYIFMFFTRVSLLNASPMNLVFEVFVGDEVASSIPSDNSPGGGITNVKLNGTP